MTKQHFIALADTIRAHNINTQNPSDQFGERQIAVLAGFCEGMNPRFNRQRWLGYIAGTNGKNGGKV